MLRYWLHGAAPAKLMVEEASHMFLSNDNNDSSSVEKNKGHGQLDNLSPSSQPEIPRSGFPSYFFFPLLKMLLWFFFFQKAFWLIAIKCTNSALDKGCHDCYLQIKKWVQRDEVACLPLHSKSGIRKAAPRIHVESLNLCSHLLLRIERNTVPCQRGSI